MINLAALGEILRRFRFHGVPGAAVASGVPIDRAAMLNSEVETVFAALRDDQRAAAAFAAEADLEVARIRSEGTEQVRKVADAARMEAIAARETVSSHLREETSKESASILTAARNQAGEVEHAAAERIPSLVSKVIETVFEMDDGR